MYLKHVKLHINEELNIMLSTYQDFINHNQRYQQLENVTYFQDVFNFLSEKMNIANMLEACKWNKSALSGCVIQLEERFPKLLKQPFNDYFIKQAIGAMIKEILAPFGYLPTDQKRMAPVKSDFFSSASTYQLDEGLRKLKLVQSWEIKKA